MQKLAVVTLQKHYRIRVGIDNFQAFDLSLPILEMQLYRGFQDEGDSMFAQFKPGECRFWPKQWKV